MDMKDYSGCFRKEAYKSEQVAEVVKKKRFKATGILLRIYQCKNHWHLTSQLYPTDI